MMGTDSLRHHYQAQFRAFGDAALGTQMSREGQRFRFGKLLEIGDLADRSVLDVGSGLGDLYPYLHAAYPNARYEGIDVVPEMVACAAGKYAGVPFRVVDLLRESLPNRYDYVLMSAIFNNAMPDPTMFLESLVEQAWQYADTGLGFNFLSSHVNFTEPTMAYHDPARVLAFVIGRLSRKVRVEHHYERCDVAMFVYR